MQREHTVCAHPSAEHACALPLAVHSWQHSGASSAWLGLGSPPSRRWASSSATGTAKRARQGAHVERPLSHGLLPSSAAGLTLPQLTHAACARASSARCAARRRPEHDAHSQKCSCALASPTSEPEGTAASRQRAHVERTCKRVGAQILSHGRATGWLMGGFEGARATT